MRVWFLVHGLCEISAVVRSVRASLTFHVHIYQTSSKTHARHDKISHQQNIRWRSHAHTHRLERARSRLTHINRRRNMGIKQMENARALLAPTEMIVRTDGAGSQTTQHTLADWRRIESAAQNCVWNIYWVCLCLCVQREEVAEWGWWGDFVCILQSRRQFFFCSPNSRLTDGHAQLITRVTIWILGYAVLCVRITLDRWRFTQWEDEPFISWKNQYKYILYYRSQSTVVEHKITDL